MRPKAAALVALLSMIPLGCGSSAAERSPEGAATVIARGGTEASSDAGAGSDASEVDSGGGGSSATGGAAAAAGAVVLSGVFNARQPGGMSTSDGRTVKANVLIRSGELGGITATGCEQFAALPIRTVVDLRAADAASSAPNAECTRDSASYYGADLPKLLPPTAENYLLTLDAMESKLQGIFEALDGEGAGLPAVVHCVIGRDRASMTMALVLLALGASSEDVLRDFTDNQESTVTVDASWLDGVLGRIDDAGGIASYLNSHGVSSATLDSLRAQALE